MLVDIQNIPVSYGTVRSFTLGKKAWEKQFSMQGFPKDFLGWEAVTKILISRSTNIHSDSIRTLDQVHGREIAYFPDSNSSEHLIDSDWNRKAVGIQIGDGLVTREPGLVLVIRTADCVPVFVYDKAKPFVAVVHSGWRGTLVGITEKLIAWMLSNGSYEENIGIYFGPSISRNNYEVQWPVAKEFLNMPPGVVQESPSGGYLLGIKEAISVRIRREFPHIKIDPHSKNVYVTDEFFSHRASEEGRNFNVIYWEP